MEKTGCLGMWGIGEAGEEKISQGTIRLQSRADSKTKGNKEKNSPPPTHTHRQTDMQIPKKVTQLLRNQRKKKHQGKQYFY